MTFRSFRYFAKKYGLTTGRDGSGATRDSVERRNEEEQSPELIGEPN
jgi:hypothetical protein